MMAGGSGLGTMIIGRGVVVGWLAPVTGGKVPGPKIIGAGVVNVLQSGTRQQLSDGSVTSLQEAG
jgi:hypothetical protein